MAECERMTGVGRGTKSRWVATPTYLCRKWLALRMLRTIPPHGRFLEIGIGAGDFIFELARLGYQGLGIDLSEQAIACSKLRLEPFRERVQIKQADFARLDGQFDLIFAFEVIEHFEEDLKVFEKLNNLLFPSGHLMISVPARMKHWGPNDQWAGHVRRYERAELKGKAESQGFETIAIQSIGVPVANLTKPVYDRMIQRQIRREGNLDSPQKTERSWNTPLNRQRHRFFSLIFNRYSMLPFLLLQCLFLRTDLGTGYLALFRKRS